MSVKDNFSVAATLSQLRYLVFQGMKGDTGDSAYEEAVKLGFVGTEEEWIASLKGEPGANGRDGQDGAPGAPGTPGRDGVSPTVQTEPISGGHRVTITDAEHPSGQTFDVMDGEDGPGAVDSVNGKTGAVVLDASDVGALPADTPIPAAVTEQTVAGWGFTKNTGTYSKPSGGIPKTDLASDVQASLGKADTALQQHQSLAGYATESYVQTQIANIPDELPTVAAADNGKFLRVVSGAWAAQAVPFQTTRVAMTSTDTTATVEPNKLYVFPEMASLTITLAAITDNTIVNEYHFIFTSGATATTLTLPASVLQPDGFTVDANMVYEVSILEGCMTAQGWAVSA